MKKLLFILFILFYSCSYKIYKSDEIINYSIPTMNPKPENPLMDLGWKISIEDYERMVQMPCTSRSYAVRLTDSLLLKMPILK